jgi:hypothetical protein
VSNMLSEHQTVRDMYGGLIGNSITDLLYIHVLFKIASRVHEILEPFPSGIPKPHMRFQIAIRGRPRHNDDRIEL